MGNLPAFMELDRSSENGRSTLNISTDKKADLGEYKVSILASIYDPYSNTVLSDETRWFLNIYFPCLNGIDKGQTSKDMQLKLDGEPLLSSLMTFVWKKQWKHMSDCCEEGLEYGLDKDNI